MQAKGDRLQLWLRTDAFDRLARNVLGEIKQHEIAERLGIHKTTWSQYRTGSRPLNSEFVAAAMDLFPDVPMTHYVQSAATAGDEA